MVKAVATAVHVAAAVTPLLRVSARVTAHLLRLGGCLLDVTLRLVRSENHGLVVRVLLNLTARLHR